MAAIETAYRRLSLVSRRGTTFGIHPSALTFGLTGVLAATAALAFNLAQSGIQRLPHILR